MNVCQGARRNGVKVVVQTSTSEVYGDAQTLPITDRHPLAPRSPYAASKVGADMVMLSFRHAFELPVVAFTLAPEVTNYTVFDVSARLREFGWLVPAYTFPENRADLSVLRVVVRAGLTSDMADLFLADVRKQTALLESLESPMPKRRPEESQSFSH